MKTLKQTINHSRKQHGVTLVELLIAITISSIVMIGISSVYTSSKRSYKLQEEFSRLQENGRFAINHITRFVRSAGYSGCASGLGAIDSILNDSDDDIWQFDTGIEGYEFMGTVPGQLKLLPASQTLPSDHNLWKTATNISLPNPGGTTDLLGHTFSPIENTDILISRTADGSGVEISTDNGGGQVFITCDGIEIDNPANCAFDDKPGVCGLCNGDIVLVSNCQTAAAFQITSSPVTTGVLPTMLSNILHAAGGGPPGNSGPSLDFDLSKGDEVMRVSTKVFYVGKGINGPSLFMKQAGADAVELVEGVESMQVLYGEDRSPTANNIPTVYVSANNVLNFANVVAVRVSILLRSVKELPWRTATSKTYHLGGMDDDTAVRLTSPSDKRLRKVMTTTIKVRNRAFSL